MRSKIKVLRERDREMKIALLEKMVSGLCNYVDQLEESLNNKLRNFWSDRKTLIGMRRQTKEVNFEGDSHSQDE